MPGAKARWLASVEAEDSEAAIAKATKELKVSNPRKLIAVRRT